MLEIEVLNIVNMTSKNLFDSYLLLQRRII